MKAIVYNAPRDWELKEIPTPQPKPNQVLIRVKACGVCRTDAHIHEGDFISKFPLTPGHEFTGEIVEVGADVKEFKAGDRVVADNTILCGECYYCRQDMDLFCEDFLSLGCNQPGGYAEYVVVNHDHVWKISDNVTYDMGCFTEPLACAIHGMDVIQPKCGDDILVFGAGATGILLTQLLQHGGATNLVVCASSQDKLDMIEKNGFATDTVLMDRNDYSKHTNYLKEKYPHGFDIVIDATGAPVVIEQLFNFPKPTGKVVFYGVAPSDAKVSVSPYQIFSQELKVLGSFAQVYCFERAVKYLELGIVKVDDLIEKHYTLDNFDEMMDDFLNKKGLKKLIVNP
ncbi:MAG: zinc-dependent alcohol dehydrogenase family protein [Blautia sp.]